MLIQKAKNGYRFIRSETDASGRINREVIGSLPTRMTEVPAELTEQLRPEERLEIAAFLASRKALDDMKRKLAVHGLAEVLTDAAEYIAALKDEDEKRLLQSVLDIPLHQLLRALR